jgi:hypothetical protein
VPAADELNAFDDPFAAFRAYLEAVLDANARDGIHAAELREKMADAFAYDVTYCAYERVAAAFGDPRLCCISSCAGDEVSFPRLCHGIGARFSRHSTLAAARNAVTSASSASHPQTDPSQSPDVVRGARHLVLSLA